MTKNPEIIAEVQTGSTRAGSLGSRAYTKINKTKDKQAHIYHTIWYIINLKKSLEFMAREAAYPIFHITQ